MNTYLKTILFILLNIGFAKAQQDPQYTFYRYSMNVINPAYAGGNEGVEFTLGVRSQWAGVQGAPESQSAIFGMPLGRNVGLGVSILNDKTFIETQTWFALDFSYNVKINENNVLYFGLKGSANSYDINTDGLMTYGFGQDAALVGLESRFTPNIGAGIYLKNNKYFLSLSAPKIIGQDRLQERDGNAFLGTNRMHGYLSGGYDFMLSKSLTLSTIAMVRYVDASPLSYELTGFVDFGKRFDLGVGYRFDESISAMVLFNVSNGFDIGYAYETALENQINGLDNATHELFMRLSL